MADVRKLEREVGNLEAEQARKERKLVKERATRDKLKSLRKDRAKDPASGRVPSLLRIAAYTRSIKQLTIRLSNLEDGIAWRTRVIRREEKAASNTVEGKAERILVLADQGRVRFPLLLSTGGTARRDIEQLARSGRVRVPVTGRTITPTGVQVKPLNAIIMAGLDGGADVNAFVGGTHRNGSLHYDHRAIDNRKGQATMSSATSRTGGSTFREATHDHNWWGRGGP